MEVEISKVSYEKIKLTEDQVEDIVVKYLKNLLLPGEWIDANNNVKGDEDHRHGSISEINYGPADATQMAAWEMIKRIQENKQQRAKLADVAARTIQNRHS
jgi:hypothetical protein